MHKNSGIHKVLNFSLIYDLLQKLAGSDRVYRYLITEELVGSTLLDIGCGTGTIAKFLPVDVDYLGYDFNEKYIEFARKQFYNQPNINFLLLNAYESLELDKKFDYILVFGLLHHLDNIGVKNVFETAQKHMHAKSVLITVDPTIYKKTSYLGKTLIRQDRGKAVRSKEELARLADTYFTQLTFEERNDFYRFPWSHVIMKASL